MDAFDLQMSNPFPAGYDRSYGGPGEGGHVSEQWYIQFGMDLGAPGGTEIQAVFDAHITRLNTGNIDASSGKVYGAEIFMRSNNDGMGAFFTHLNDLPPELSVGSQIARGQVLGRVIGTPTPHVHLALVEIIAGSYVGVDLYEQFKLTANSTVPFNVTFHQDGITAPSVDRSDGHGGGLAGFGSLSTVSNIQGALSALGFDPGIQDGIIGPRTVAAITEFQVANGLAADGVAGPRTLAALLTALIGAGLAPG